MSYYCHQISYTSKAWSNLIENPQDRFELIRGPIEHFGGKIRAAFFTTGRFDVLAITEFPENFSPSDLSVAFAKGGAIADIQTIPLLSATQAIEAHLNAHQPIYSAGTRKRVVAASAGS